MYSKELLNTLLPFKILEALNFGVQTFRNPRLLGCFLRFLRSQIQQVIHLLISVWIGHSFIEVFNFTNNLRTDLSYMASYFLIDLFKIWPA